MRLLFFSPFCGQTGSELVLHNLILNADREKFKMAVACGSRGGLSQRFPADVPVYRYWHALSLADRAFKNNSLGARFASQVFNGIIRVIHERVKPDVWYVNTIVQPSVLALARELKVPCILHMHEFEYALSLIKAADIEDLINYPKLIIAVSDCAAQVARVLGRRENIEVCYAPIDISKVRSEEQDSRAIRSNLGIPSDAFVWAMSGSRDLRKNPVVFVRIAAELLKHAPEAYFIWIGGEDTGYSHYAKALAGSLKADRNIIWISEVVESYFDYLNVADGLVMTSSDESLSIVTLEAAALGKPFVSFDSGGPKEVFREGMGAIVNSWNVEDMVTAMLKVMRGDIHLNADGSRRRAAEFDVSVLVKQWERLIEKYIVEIA